MKSFSSSVQTFQLVESSFCASVGGILLSDYYQGINLNILSEFSIYEHTEPKADINKTYNQHKLCFRWKKPGERSAKIVRNENTADYLFFLKRFNEIEALNY